MEKAIKNKKFFLIMGIISSFVAISSAIISWILVGAEAYIPLIPLFAVSAYGFYSAPFYFFYAHDAKEVIRLIPVIEKHGIDNIRSIAADMGWRRNVTRAFIKKSKKRGYIIENQPMIMNDKDNSL